MVSKELTDFPRCTLYPHSSVNLFFAAFVLSGFVLSMFPGCTGETSSTFDVKRDHEAISFIVDAAVLSDNPPREFQKALTQVRSFPSVDSAWTDGTTFFVKYKNGGTVSWTAPPEPTTQNHQ